MYCGTHLGDVFDLYPDHDSLLVVIVVLILKPGWDRDHGGGFSLDLELFLIPCYLNSLLQDGEKEEPKRR